MRAVSIVAVLLLPSAALGGVVISEIHYHPAENELAFEWIEIANDSATPVDISGYAFVNGVDFVFPEGAILSGRGFIVVARDADAVSLRHGIEVLGNFTGRLDNDGERITIANHAGVTVASVRYRDRGKWPVGPDGSGHTLALRDVHLDASEPESWAQSAELEGTPGAPNFESREPEVEERVFIDRGETWRLRKGTAAFSVPADAWLAPAFDDGGWSTGASGFGYGDGDDATVLDDMQNGYSSIAIRKRFDLSAADLATPGDFFLGVDYDDGFCAYLNGQEIARENCGSAGSVPVWDSLATGSHEAGSEVLFVVPRALLVEGENVLALAGFNLSLGSSDFSLAPRLVQRTVPGGVPTAVEEVIIAAGAEWRFRKGTAAFSAPALAWVAAGFNDAGWAPGRSGFGFRTVGGEEFTAYGVPAGTVGNQTFAGALGMDFDVNEEIVVTRLGVFDSGSDGLNRSITARLHDRSTGAELARLDFSPASPGELVDGNRFKDLPEPLGLVPGFAGTMTASGYGDGEPNGNQGSADLGLTTDDGQASISFVGGGRFGSAPDAFPDTVDGGPENRYAAGTFVFRAAGAPGGAPVAPPGVSTLLDDMPGAYTSIACRARFDLAPEDLEPPGDFFLGIDYDDGFCAFINGVELARVNCGSASPAWNDVATAARETGGEQLFAIPRQLLVAGENVIAIAGYNVAADNPDFLLASRVFKRTLLQPVGVAAEIVFNELFRGGAPGQGWVELHNPTGGPVDVSGFTITDDPDRPDPHRLADGTMIGGGGFLVVGEEESGLDLSAPEVRLFLINADGLVAAAATFDRQPPSGLVVGQYAELRYPDGDELDWVSDEPTRGAANRVPVVDAIVINEIMYHPPEDREGEYIELYNRGDVALDLTGFSLAGAVTYALPDGVALGAGEYLVITSSPQFLMEHHGVEALGPWQGQLSNRGESIRLLDAWGNLADRVRYHEGGRWSLWADGRGSSLELIDPHQDNSVGSAWEASDETGKSAWEEHTFRVPDYRPAPESELNLRLAERGECLVDDISVRRGGGANHIPNPGFEASTSPWRIDGTHIHSVRTTADSRSGSACLHMVSTGKGDTLVNRIEVDTSPALSAGPYDVSLWTRWLRGTSLMIVHGEYTSGPYPPHPCITCGVAPPNFSGNPLAAAIRMTVPFNLGTPGTENSARVILREDTGSDNLGPVIGDVMHTPPFPEPGQPVPVTARVSDSDGVRSVQVFHRAGSAAGEFQSTSLFDDGLHGDGASGDGVYGGQLPGFSNRIRVVYYVEAVDTTGAARRFPVDAPGRTCLFQVQSPPRSSNRDAYSLILDTQRTAELQARQLHSNDLLDGAFVFEDERAHYNIGTRYRGSPWGRPSRASYRVRFPRDDVFHRGLRNINISRAGSNANEGSAHFLTERNATPGKPAPTADFLYTQFWVNGSDNGAKAMIEPIDGSFSSRWYGDDSEGPLLKAWGRFVFTDGGRLTGQQGWEGASLLYRGDNAENYRGYFGHSMAETRDDWQPLFALTSTLDASQTSNAQFDEEAGQIVDFDSFFQVLAARVLLGDGDAFGVNNGHNGYLSFDSINGQWGILAFDLEAAFRFASPNLFSSLDRNIQRLMTRPASQRAYVRVLDRYVDGYWSEQTPAPFLTSIQREIGVSTGNVRSFVSASARRTRSILRPFVEAPFRIVTNGGADITSDEPTIVLEGEAPADVESIVYRRGESDFEPLDPRWTTPTRWTFEFDLPEPVNEFELIGFDSAGSIVGTATIRVATSAGPRIVVSGWFPDSGPAAGGTTVTFLGSGFADNLAVRFGGVESPRVTVHAPDVMEAVSPPATLPLPVDGMVDVELIAGVSRLSLPRAFTYLPVEGGFVRGDANTDGGIDLSDAVTILLHLFTAGESLRCAKSADINDSGDLNLTDPIVLLDYLFRGGGTPPAPFPTCGEDPSADTLECETFAPCGG